MIPDDRLREIAKQLLARTRANAVEWKVDSDNTAGGAFLLLVLPHSQIRILSFSPKAEPDRVVMQVCNEAGRRVAELRADEGDEDWELLRQLHDEAYRYATGWDKVLSDIEDAIFKSGKIGLSEGG
jgi:hypothetical protein